MKALVLGGITFGVLIGMLKIAQTGDGTIFRLNTGKRCALGALCLVQGMIIPFIVNVLANALPINNTLLNDCIFENKVLDEITWEDVMLNSTTVSSTAFNSLSASQAWLSSMSWNKGQLAMEICLAIFAGCLMMACVTDCRCCMVYNYVWWFGGIAAWIMWWLGIGRSDTMGMDGLRIFQELVMLGKQVSPLLVFAILQESFFAKMYGRADSHAFAVCSLVLNVFGMRMKEYLIHMLIAFGLLFLVQVWHHNIGRNGNLKEPVPFLPYITVAFWILLITDSYTAFIHL